MNHHGEEPSGEDLDEIDELHGEMPILTVPTATS